MTQKQDGKSQKVADIDLRIIQSKKDIENPTITVQTTVIKIDKN